MKLQTICLALALSACQAPAPVKPVATPPRSLAPTDAADSTFRVNMLGRIDGSDEDFQELGTGTAWVVYNKAQSFLITAGHVCAQEEPLVEYEYTLTARDGTVLPAEIVRKSDKYDLCLLETTGVVGPAMELAPVAPVYDELVMAVGAPLGVFACYGGSSLDECGMAPISRGYYAGGNLVSMPMVSGNSGSAVFTSHGVIGVLVEGYRGFDSLSFIEPESHLIAFLSE